MILKTIRLKEKVLSCFYNAWKAFSNPQYLNYYFKGGRGSSKSTTITIRLIMNRMKYKSHALCVRKYKNTLRHSVRNQVIWSIYHLGVEDYWEWSNSKTGDMTLTYKPFGTKIYFEGSDSDKIKGWKTPDMPTTDIFFEEIADFKTDEELTSIKLSIMRENLPEGFKYTFFHAYNPPKRRHSWVNKLCESVVVPDNMYIHHSTYLTNDKLPKEFIEEAEIVKAKNYKRYEWEYLGKPIGSGVVPFDNLAFETMSDEQIRGFDNIRMGLDWGYGVDPAAFIRLYYDKTRRKIYLFDEIEEVKLSNASLADKIKAKKYLDTYITADSSEPKSIANLKNDYGIKWIRGAKKGPGSVETGEKWLDELEAIVIDPQRCPNAAREFESIDYQTDKDGNPKNRLEDKDNHCLIGDTLVDTPQGQIPIKKLKDNQEVYCFNEKNKKMDIKKCFDVRMTQKKVKVYKVKTVDNREFKATENHPVLTDRGWVLVKNLKNNDKIIDISNAI